MRLHIDVETYSSIDISEAGAYTYAESVDFEVLMVAYAYDDEPVRIVDLAKGEKLPKDFIAALKNPDVVKHAHNATFERYAFKAIGYDVPINQWKCTLASSAYCGWPLSLDAVSKAMRLGDEGKSATGRALIKYFCMPCKPTAANGHRERNLPEHDPQAWEEFKDYCMQDVEAEREVGRRLNPLEDLEAERRMYILDQEINDRGVMIDTALAANAQKLGDKHSKTLLAESKRLTGLSNPNSHKQLSEWLSVKLGRDIKSIAKDEILILMKEAELVADSDLIKRVLEIRQYTSKTSIKKYAAMQNSAADDGRAHGAFQIYGANRTGRWAGRLIQLQNLPRNYMDDLEQARELVKNGSYEMIAMQYENVADILSQLLRTALIAKPGHVFAVSDFSAIEARVLAWLANEEWRLDVFATHGKIYEASAAMMFHIPIEEVDDKMRQKGKIAELALGYQGSLGALKTMGGEAMGLSETEMRDIVNTWRKANPAIAKLWDDVNDALITIVKRGGKRVLNKYKNLTFESDGRTLTILLPSGRRLYYQEPRMTTNKWGGPSIKYKGNFGWEETYGGSVVENICQAIARDLLSYSMLRVDEEGFDIVIHVHDEIVVEVPEEGAEDDLQRLYAIMGETVPWASDLILKADGFITPFYKKD